jgi:N-acetylglutamate synthase-like GNAT family acetyltransferase
VLTVRRARGEDAESVGRVHRSAIRGLCRTHYTDEQIEAWSGPRPQGRFEKAISEREFYVAEREGEVVGFGNLDREAGEVEAVYVAPDAAGRGVGMKLLRTVEARARELGIKSLSVDASLNAVGFYERAGFVLRATGAHRLWNGVDLPCAHMSKELAD